MLLNLLNKSAQKILAKAGVFAFRLNDVYIISLPPPDRSRLLPYARELIEYFSGCGIREIQLLSDRTRPILLHPEQGDSGVEKTWGRRVQLLQNQCSALLEVNRDPVLVIADKKIIHANEQCWRLGLNPHVIRFCEARDWLPLPLFRLLEEGDCDRVINCTIAHIPHLLKVKLKTRSFGKILVIQVISPALLHKSKRTGLPLFHP